MGMFYNKTQKYIYIYTIYIYIYTIYIYICMYIYIYKIAANMDPDDRGVFRA